eukprot:3059321-Prymnesium_polylepis.1
MRVPWDPRCPQLRSPHVNAPAGAGPSPEQPSAQPPTHTPPRPDMHVAAAALRTAARAESLHRAC